MKNSGPLTFPISYILLLGDNFHLFLWVFVCLFVLLFNAINLNQHCPVEILEPHMSIVNVLVETFKK